MFNWVTITSLGNVTNMAAVAAAIAMSMLAQRAWRIAFWWCLLLAGSTALVVATKIAFIGWGIGIPPLDFKGISGHSMRATAILPVIFYLSLLDKPARTRMIGMLLGIALGVGIIISRRVLHFHSTSEAVAGGVLGIMVSLSMISMLRTVPKMEFTRPLLAFSLLVLLAAPQTEPAPTQRWITALALFLSDQQTRLDAEDSKIAVPYAFSERGKP